MELLQIMRKSKNSYRTHRVSLITDLHFRSDGVPGFLDTQVKTLLKLVNKKPPQTLVILGDIFEKRNPRGAELLAFREFLEKVSCKDVYILRGNHDTIRKDGTSDTTLSLFSDIATVVCDYEVHRIGGMDFDFIPHYENEEVIINHLSKTNNPVFGHFGFDGCVSNGPYAYESYVKRKHFKKRLAFLGHIHRPKVYNNIHILGTPYTNTFGEANNMKYYHELLIFDGAIEVVRKPIEFGIKHVLCKMDELAQVAGRIKFKNFFTLLRVKLDSLDSYAEVELRNKLFEKYSINQLDIVFEDIFEKTHVNFIPSGVKLQWDESLIEDFISSSDTVFTEAELRKSLSKVKDNEN